MVEKEDEKLRRYIERTNLLWIFQNINKQNEISGSEISLRFEMDYLNTKQKPRFNV